MRPDGERAFLTHPGHQSSYSLSHDQRRLVNVIKAGDIVHFSGYFMQPKLRRETPRIIETAKERGAKISFDPGWDPDGFESRTRNEIANLLARVDFFEPNHSELQAIAGMKSVRRSLRRLERYFNGILALKKGRAGSQIFVGCKSVAKVGAFPLKSVIDSTGAGDAFDGGFLHGIVHGKSFMESARYGNAAAALLISSRSYSTLRFPSKRLVERLIRS